MKLTILVDNNTYIDQYYLGEPGVSYFIEDCGIRILFDTGYSDVYVRNAKKMGIDLSELDAVVLSHGHNDHTGGLAWFPKMKRKPKLIGHPQVLERKRVGELTVCSPLAKEVLSDMFEVCLSSEPVRISEHILYLGQIQRRNTFENTCPIGERFSDGEWKPDFLLDDSALVYIDMKEKNISIITGCSHAGICNIIEQAKTVTRISTVKRVIGGFHLLDGKSLQTIRTAEYLKNEKIPYLYPCHCTCFKSKAEIHRNTPVEEVGVGAIYEW